MNTHQRLLRKVDELLSRRQELFQRALSYQLPPAESRKFEKPEWTEIRLVAIQLDFVIDELISAWRLQKASHESKKGAGNGAKRRTRSNP